MGSNQEVGTSQGGQDASPERALRLIQIQGRKKKEIPHSLHPFSSELPTGRAAKPWEAAGADKGGGLTEARALD